MTFETVQELHFCRERDPTRPWLQHWLGLGLCWCPTISKWCFGFALVVCPMQMKTDRYAGCLVILGVCSRELNEPSDVDLSMKDWGLLFMEAHERGNKGYCCLNMF